MIPYHGAVQLQTTLGVYLTLAYSRTHTRRPELCTVWGRDVHPSEVYKLYSCMRATCASRVSPVATPTAVFIHLLEERRERKRVLEYVKCANPIANLNYLAYCQYGRVTQPPCAVAYDHSAHTNRIHNTTVVKER